MKTRPPRAPPGRRTLNAELRSPPPSNHAPAQGFPKGSGMGKRAIAIVFIAVLFAVSTGYDFYRGYHAFRSIIGGIVSIIFGLVILGRLEEGRVGEEGRSRGA